MIVFIHQLSQFSKIQISIPPRQKPENMSSKLSNGMESDDQPRYPQIQKARVKPMAYRMDCMLVTPNFVVIFTKC